MRKAQLLCLLALSIVTCAGAARAQDAQTMPTGPTIVLILRHAEKAQVEGNDPPLSEAGIRRAQELVRVAEDAGVTAIYTTQYKRALDTAAPLASRLGITATAVEITRENVATYPASLARQILARHAGQTVMVLGHSNTVPLIVEALGGRRPAAIDDATEFDRLYVVIIRRPGEVRTIEARYGQESMVPSRSAPPSPTASAQQ